MDATSSSPTPADAHAWRVHPAADHPARTAVVVLVLVLAALTCARWSESAIVGWIAFGVLAASLRAYFLPCHYEIDDDGVHEDGLWGPRRTLPWSAVRRVALDPRGVVVSPRATLSRWLPDRGVYLRTRGKTQRAAVLAAVEARAELPTDNALPEGVTAS